MKTNNFYWKQQEEVPNGELCWNVFVENFNGRKMEIHNVFDHGRFFESLVNDKKEMEKKFGVKAKDLMDSEEAFKFFEEKVKGTFFYYYGSKCEWEIVLTSWPPYVEAEELDRLVKEKDEHIEKYGYFYRTNLNLDIGAKVDVFDQVSINWSNFMIYLWNNLDLIKTKKVKK